MSKIDLDEVLLNSIPLDDNIASGIYFLISKGEVVYVGQSKSSVFARIRAHMDDKIFDRYSIIPCPIEELDVLESHYIAHFTPKYNRTLKANDSIVFIRMLEAKVENTAGMMEFVVIGGKLYAKLDSLKINTQMP